MVGQLQELGSVDSGCREVNECVMVAIPEGTVGDDSVRFTAELSQPTRIATDGCDFAVGIGSGVGEAGDGHAVEGRDGEALLTGKVTDW